MLYARSKEILSHGSFNLRKFTTNAAALQTLVDVEEATHKQVNPCGVAQADEPHGTEQTSWGTEGSWCSLERFAWPAVIQIRCHDGLWYPCTANKSLARLALDF